MAKLDQTGVPFLTRDDLDFGQSNSFSLVIDAVAHSTAVIELRGYTKAGFFTHRIVPTAVNSLQTFTRQVDDIPIAVSAFYNPTDFATPSAYLAIHLAIGTNRIQLFCQGTITSINGISGPIQQQPITMQSQGTIMSVTGANPAAGVEIASDTPDNEVWEILGINIALVTDATVATRTVQLQILGFDGYNVIRSSVVTQAASLTRSYNWVPDGVNAAAAVGTYVENNLPKGIFLPPFSAIATVTTNFQAGDNWAAPVYWVRKHYTPVTGETLLAA